MMGRPRKHPHKLDFLPRVQLSHGAYYLITTGQKWVKLGRAGHEREALEEYGRLTLSPVRLRDMAGIFDRYEREIVPTKAPRTQRDNHSEMALLRVAFGKMKPGDITPQHVYGYMDRRPSTRANREVALLSNVLNYAIRWGELATNPCKQVSRNREHPRRRYITDAEFWAAHEEANQTVRCAMMLSLITGLRQGDVLDLTMRSITADGLLVAPGKTHKKTGQTMLFRWTPELRRAVDDARAIKQPVRGLHLLCKPLGSTVHTRGVSGHVEAGRQEGWCPGFPISRYSTKGRLRSSNGRAFGALGQAGA